MSNQGLNPIPLCRYLSAVLIFAVTLASGGAAAEDAVDWKQRAEAAAARGDFAAAEHDWLEEARFHRQRGGALKAAGALTRRAEALRAQGSLADALASLLEALALAETADDSRARAEARLGLGQTYFLMGEMPRARENLELCLDEPHTAGSRWLEALALNELGNVASGSGDLALGLDYYSRAQALFEPAATFPVAAKAAINAARAALTLGQRKASESRGRSARGFLAAQPAGHEKAQGLVALANYYRDLGGAQARLVAYELLRQAEAIAREIGDPVIEAAALGYMGELYERERRYRAAGDYTQRALSTLLGVDRPEMQYLFEWQLGRILAGEGDRDAGIALFRRAIATLERVRRDFVSGPLRRHISFRRQVGDVYYGLAALLLDRAATAQGESRAADLFAARETMELLKAVELEDYFRDDCIAALERKKVALDAEVDKGTVAVYPIVLPDRLELLLSYPDEIRAHRVEVSADDLSREVNAFRRALESYRSDDYRVWARRLYDRLVAPLEQEFEHRGIHTIVVIPDSILRTVPLAPLYDGERFLIEKYAVVTTPGLVLTDPKPLSRDAPNMLLAGLTESVQGFSALPAVAEELEAIQRIYQGQVLQDETFRTRRVRDELEQNPYTIVHIATHGKIESDVRESFLLTFDGKLRMDDLEEYIGAGRFRDIAVEMLTLSACQTAVGDDRAALGLAGIALKAGARTALATLWSISDEATATLVPRFYGYLAEPGMSKARALQKAQRDLLAVDRFRHPGFWAPFLLIGNWQ